ncbi:lipocalin family protein [Telluribacter humicola]|uniref:lipocalin family protein n=1 Tax=Telluribacter humicola TaxID=1720261 RepID=UPI001A9776EF|nr:lipocalin family protein [Telluribacter humicola]
MKKLSLLLSFVLLISCEKEELSTVERSIVGKWQLVEYCVSPGSGECNAQMATAIYTQTVEFREDGSFIEKIPERQKFWTPIMSSGQYRILEGKGKIEFQFDVSSSRTPVGVDYQLSGNRMTLLPGCFEGCRYTYEKVR